MGVDSNSISVSLEQLERFIAAALRRAGLPEGDAATVAGLMAQADLQGSDGHGVIRLPQYVRRIRSGGINVRPDIRVVADMPGMAVVDGDNGMGHLVVSRATAIAIDKARTQGAAWVGTRRSNHAGPASLYSAMPLRHDMVGIYFAVGNANHLPPWGGTDMLLSTNPISVGVPAGDEPPVVLDMATTVAAYGKVKAKAKRGEMMPEGWMIDRQGRPLLDPARSDEGFLMPIGGHKGYGLALMVGLLAGTLNGAAMGRDVVDFNKDHVTPTNTGQAMLVLNLAAFGPVQGFKEAVDRLVGDLRGSARMPGTERIWMPGEQSHVRRRHYRETGIPVSRGVAAELDQLARELEIPLLAS
ncbi:lactate dehydrogenase [Pigmentiphaga sp. NML030171]|uniref:Ldh family oxidoreductase n=1 Tax=Pigmentiphaga sp. NML030171 TaxID=2008676 RepID=UPI000B418C3D|nr:Ldh family oxidoreductase [Pigmentiphaga sp. NML030171]OVZ66187.1 lactate dehydrogenase [Pigmentiphaga sp. NML030171]